MPALISSSATTHSGTMTQAKRAFINRTVSCTAEYSDYLPADVVSLSSDLLQQLYGENASDSEKFIVVHGINQEQATGKKWTLYQVADWSVQKPGNSNLFNPPEACIFSFHNKMMGPPAHSRILIQAVSPVFLDQALLLCTPQSYERLESSSHEELMQQLLGTGDQRIVRQGEYDVGAIGQFKLCEPVDQGILTRSTKVTVIKDQVVTEPKENGMHIEDIEDEIANYLDFNSKSRPSSDLLQITLDTKPLDEPISVHSIIPPPEPKDDPESRVFVRIEQILSIGCFSGDVVGIFKVFWLISNIVGSTQN